MRTVSTGPGSREANPESIDAAGLARPAELWFTRISLGMQLGVPPVLATLDRVHSPGRPARAVAEATGRLLADGVVRDLLD